MWKLGRLLHLLEHWHLLLCHNEHVYHLSSLLSLVDLHRLSFCLDGWYLVLLHNWDIDDRDVLDQRNWYSLHLWRIDNFVDGLCLSLHWDTDNLVGELHLRDLHCFLHLLNHRHLACTTTGTSAICFPPQRSLPRSDSWYRDEIQPHRPGRLCTEVNHHVALLPLTASCNSVHSEALV